jgi:hypothetical protein
MTMQDVLATIVVPAEEAFPMLAAYFKSLHTKEKRNDHVNDADQEFEHP